MVLRCFRAVSPISIHAPARGATNVGNGLGNRTVDFNPRSREGSDGHLRQNCLAGWIFQSTLPRGERPELVVLLAKGELFQSTLPRGERLTDKKQLYSLSQFQSTLPRGERLFSNSSRFRKSSISIHAPARGATDLTFL